VKPADDYQRRTGVHAFDPRDAVFARDDGRTFSGGRHDCVSHTGLRSNSNAAAEFRLFDCKLRSFALTPRPRLRRFALRVGNVAHGSMIRRSSSLVTIRATSDP
jgi:hypothetical protein